MILNQTYLAHPMRFLEAADPIALAALEHVLERDAQDVRKLLEWLPAAQTRRDLLSSRPRVRISPGPPPATFPSATTP